MDLRKIKKLIDLLEESNLAEIEIKEGEESVRLARVPKGTAMMSAPVQQYAPAPAAQAPAAATMPMQSPTEASTGGAKQAAALPEATCCARRWSARSTPRPRPTSRPSSP